MTDNAKRCESWSTSSSSPHDITSAVTTIQATTKEELSTTSKNVATLSTPQVAKQEVSSPQVPVQTTIQTAAHNQAVTVPNLPSGRQFKPSAEDHEKKLPQLQSSATLPHTGSGRQD